MQPIKCNIQEIIDEIKTITKIKISFAVNYLNDTSDFILSNDSAIDYL